MSAETLDAAASTSAAVVNDSVRQLPFAYETKSGADFFSWIADRREEIDAQFRYHGAVLFRGFGLAEHSVFDRLLQTMCRRVIAGYGDLPPEKGMERVYGSTPYRADRAILFHNESSHMHTWPTRQFFACVIAPAQGGETPVVDCRRIYERLPRAIGERFATKGLLYIRHFIEGFDVSWQDFFKVSDRSALEAKCKERGAKFEWTSSGALRFMQPAQAVARNVVTGELSFFNQIMLHHPHFLPAEDREALAMIFGANGLPRMVTYGDGSQIEPAVLDEIAAMYGEESKSFAWQQGDLLMVDNMSIAHGRSPFTGPRKIIVGMGDPIEMYRDAAPALA